MARDRIEPYTALIIQPEVTVVDSREGIQQNLDRVKNLIHFGVGYFWEVPVRLVVLPEYFLQGVGTPGKGETGIGDAMKKAVTIPGPEIDQLAEIAQEYGLYLCGGGVMEKVPEFPDRWFNSNFIIGPSGDVVLKYHKWHIPAYIGLGTSPHDLFDEYCEKLGGDIKDLFPVIDTEIGKLGTMTCHDGCTPEVSRALGYNGVEVICHPGAIQEVEGVSQPWDFWMFTRRTRAHDNMCYLLGSNWGSVNYDYYPKAFCPGHSFAIDYTGMVLREAPYPAEQVLAVGLDIEALRRHRTLTIHNCWWISVPRASGRYTTSRFIRPIAFRQAIRPNHCPKKSSFAKKSSTTYTGGANLHHRQDMNRKTFLNCCRKELIMLKKPGD